MLFPLRLLFLFLKVSTNGSFPEPLSQEEEKECFALAKKGDKQAREKLITHNLRLVAHIIKKYYASGKNQDDLMSVGTIGLIKAIDSFDPDNGAKFATYAGKCLQNEILMYFRSQKKLSNEVSMYETIDTDKDGNPLTYLDIIKTEDTIAEDIDKHIMTEKTAHIVRTVLNERERSILCQRYGLTGQKPLTQREISEKMGISRSYVSRMEKAALEKIRDRLKNKPY